MKTPTINSRILKLEVLKDTATRTSVNAVESRTTSLESDIATAQGDISTLQTDVSAVEGDISTLQGDVATLTQGIASAVSTHNTAPDSHADLRTLVAGKQDSLTISTVGEAMLAIATPSGQKIPRVNADGSVVLINVPSGDGVGGSSWYASDDGPPSVGISLSWVSNGDANGVVYLAGRTLGNGSFTNPSISGGPLAMLRSSNGDGNAMQLTDRAPNVSYSANIQNSWICCDLGAYALGLTSYSLRHQSSLNVDHIRTWRLQGSNMVTWSIAGVAAAEWVDVDVRSNDTTISAVDAWGHWSLPQQAPSYRYIRLLQDGPNSTNRYYLTVAEWEFYGTLTGTAATRPLPAGSAGWARNSELIDDATAWMPYYATSALTDGTPIFGTAYDVASAVSTHNTAPDAHADIRTLVADRALIGHQHARADLPWVTEPGAAMLTAASASAQRTALGMTAWAVAPWTDGTTSDIHEGTQLYFTNARADARADARIAVQKGQAEGIMPLDSSGKAPLAYMPDALIGQVKFKGVWDAATNSPVLPSATTSMGHYYVTSVAGSYGGIDYGVGDWCISDGTTWGKVDNSDAITSFAGRVGAILPISSDYSAHYLGLHAQADDAARLGGQLPSYYAQAGHVHNYAGSSTPGGAATYAGLLEPISGPAYFRLAYTADGACIYPGVVYGRVVMRYDRSGDTYDVRVGLADVVSDSSFSRIAHPRGGVFVSQTNAQTGAITVQLPVGMSKTMCCVTVKVFDYASGESFEIHVCGYSYSVDKSWINPTAYIVGNPNTDLQYTVRLGYDSTADKAMMYIGELSTVWDFPQIYVTEVLCGYEGYSEAWTSGWQVGFETAEFKNVTATITGCQVGYKPQTVFTGAKVIGGTTLNFVNGLLVS